MALKKHQKSVTGSVHMRGVKRGKRRAMPHAGYRSYLCSGRGCDNLIPSHKNMQYCCEECQWSAIEDVRQQKGG